MENANQMIGGCRLGGRVSRCHGYPAARHFQNEYCGLH